ncbi:endonuclease [uncultured Brachyspira sp.]|uniref:endonuclease n=1 Tax=uncultured Brachyspira sp. TaxID=221953 RepID=UPI0025CFCEB6|nr:endonuclease [uncultured Brachyspira sp.]
MSFIDKHHANKKLSIYTSIVTFIIGCVWIVINLIIKDRIITKDEAVAVVIVLLGLNSVSIGSDLMAFLKIIKGRKEEEQK